MRRGIWVGGGIIGGLLALVCIAAFALSVPSFKQMVRERGDLARGVDRHVGRLDRPPSRKPWIQPLGRRRPADKIFRHPLHNKPMGGTSSNEYCLLPIVSQIGTGMIG